MLLKGIEQELVSKKQISINYDASAPIYDKRYHKIQFQKYKEIFSRVDISEKNTIIDVGCGTGDFLGLILQSFDNYFSSLIGVDFSYEMIRKAHTKYPNIDFIVADSDHLPFCDNLFDRIFSITHLQNLPEPELSIKEMNRVAKSKALIALSILNKTWNFEKLHQLLFNSHLQVITEWIVEIEDIGVICSKL